MSRTLIFLAGRRPLTVPRVFNQAVCAVQQEPSRRIQTSAAAAVNAGTFPHLGSDDRRLAFAGAEVRVRGIRDLSEPAGNRVTVSPQGQVFVNFPFWSDDHTLSVAESIDGQPKPFPDEAWNAKSGPPENRRICVQSVVVDDQGALWILDPASPKTEGVVKGGPKLVKVDLSTNKVVQTIPFDDTIAPTFLFKRCPHGY